MNYDKLVNQILQEQYFGGSPYERSTRIKRHVGPVSESELSMAGLKDIEAGFSQDKDSTAFKQKAMRIDGVIERAAQDTADWFTWASDHGKFEGMKPRAIAKGLATVALKAASTDIPDDTAIETDPGSELGFKVLNPGTFDGWNIPHFKKLFERVGELTTGKMPMSAERLRNIILMAINNAKTALGVGKHNRTDQDGQALEPFEDPSHPNYIG